MKELTRTPAAVESVLAVAWHFSSMGGEGACCGEVSLAEFRALQTAVALRDCSVQDIGKKLGFTKSGATRVVNRLERHGLVTKCRSVEDARFCCIAPTANGLDLLHDAARVAHNRLEQALRSVNISQRLEIMRALAELAGALSYLDE